MMTAAAILVGGFGVLLIYLALTQEDPDPKGFVMGLFKPKAAA